jgi:hypothetical protein
VLAATEAIKRSLAQIHGKRRMTIHGTGRARRALTPRVEVRQLAQLSLESVPLV